MRLPAREYEGMARHLRRHPPGDLHAHSILAAIWAAVVSALGGRSASPYEVAPWLRDNGAAAKGERRKQAQLSRAAQLMGDAGVGR